VSDKNKIQRASEEWRNGVVNFTRRNTLLVFKSGTSTIELNAESISAVSTLLGGGPVGLSQLVPPSLGIEAADKAAEKLKKKQDYLLEELGVSPINLAIGFASWNEDSLPEDKIKSQKTNAPIFLLPVEIERSKIGNDRWKLRATQELRVNGILAHAANAAGIKFDENRVLDSMPETVDLETVLLAVESMRDFLSGLREFETSSSMHIAAFSYQDEAIYRDLSDVESLSDSDIILALAGDGEAIARVQDIKEVDVDAPDRIAPELENLILDADSSQIEAINTAISGSTVVIEGPPGTGKSQTISNLLAEALAQNKKVLFVAQKRAAIDAVLKRLSAKGLDSLVLDVHEASRGPQVAAQLASSFANMRNTPPADLQATHENLKEARDNLVAVRDAFVRETRGLGLTLSDLRELYYSTNQYLPSKSSLEPEVLKSLTSDDYRLACKAITAIAETDGLSSDFDSNSHSWNVSRVRTRNDLVSLIQSANAFEKTILQSLLKLVGDSLGMDSSIRGLYRQARIVAINGWLSVQAPKLLKKPRAIELLSLLRSGLNPNSETKLTILEKFKVAVLRKTLLPKDLSTAILSLDVYLELIEKLDTKPAKSSQSSLTTFDWAEMLRQTESAQRLMESVQGLNLDEMSWKSFTEHVKNLATDSSQYKIATFWENFDVLKARGLEAVVDDLRSHNAGRSFQVHEFEMAFMAAASNTLIHDALTFDSRLQGLDGATLDRVSARFRTADRKHLSQNAHKIKRIAAENFKSAVDSHRIESVFLEGEANKKRAHKPLRALISRAPNLMLAANPIWAMSPIQVASYLPRKKMFDLVVFDEASQVKPEMAIPSILRGHSLVVAGDSNQLPPTNFFSGGGLDIVDEAVEDDDYETTTKDSESILEAMERIVGTRKKRLLWHYRSRDERLIALSNIEIYGNSLTTFPASDTPDAVEHVLASPGRNAKVASNSQNDEAQLIVELIAKHVETRPDESLGVITFGTTHLQKLEMAVHQARSSNPKLNDWLEKDTSEPFFLKNLERVQGDERDAIIISTGYGKDSNGKMNLRWGPLNSESGRRRLNVAISRAKRRMTLVTNFTIGELSDQKVREGTGVDLFKKFLDYMGNAGASYERASTSIELNPFELDIKRKLESAGLGVVAQFGVGNYRIDFAIRHPKNPSEFVLAVEADGASYHSGHIARERDRLRQTLLENRGWRFHRIWSTDWFRNSDAEVERVIASYKAACDGVGKDVQELSTESERTEQVLKKPVRKLPMPALGSGGNIAQYTITYIDSVIEFIESDGLLRKNEEILKEARQIMGFSRNGDRIEQALLASMERIRNRG
jgi:very-short-patch-repair endonuclease